MLRIIVDQPRETNRLPKTGASSARMAASPARWRALRRLPIRAVTPWQEHRCEEEWQKDSAPCEPDRHVEEDSTRQVDN